MLAGDIDREMMARDIPPNARPIALGRLLWEAFEWEGRMSPPDAFADQPGYEGEVLMAKLQRWYSVVYADRLKVDAAIGWTAYKIANHVWKVRLPMVFGRIELFMDGDPKNVGTRGLTQALPRLNVISCIDGITSEIATRVPANHWIEFFHFFNTTMNTMNWRDALRNNVLLTEALKDYATSVDELIASRFAQSRWSSAQSAEKTLKGCLALSSASFETKGGKGHDLVRLGQQIDQTYGVRLDETLLRQAQCAPSVRYGEEDSTLQQALTAHHAVLEVFAALGASAALSGVSKVEVRD